MEKYFNTKKYNHKNSSQKILTQNLIKKNENKLFCISQNFLKWLSFKFLKLYF
jgi:hypothetical protein